MTQTEPGGMPPRSGFDRISTEDRIMILRVVCFTGIIYEKWESK